MRNFFEWLHERRLIDHKPWLILGKGPTFSKRDKYDLSDFNIMTLNHAVREQRATVAHMIDFDVLDKCQDCIEENTEVLIMPWIPHVNNAPGKMNLAELARSQAILQRLEEQGRLLWYNLSSGYSHREGSPVVKVQFFSAEAALNLLAMGGVERVRSLGIDGGASYSGEFEDLKDKTLLANGRTSFDRQFEEIAKTIMVTNVDYAPLDVESPIRVYVATTEAQMLATKVLEYSIKKHASMTAEVYPMHLSGIDIPSPKEIKHRPRTPFSFQRFLIPQLAGYKGRAIYLDSDMQVFKDIRALWVMPFKNADVLAVDEPVATGRRPQFSVMLLDCDALRWKISDIISQLDDGGLTYEELMYEMAVAANVRRAIDSSWNCLERFDAGRTALLHYTDMEKQPWVSTVNSLGYLWMRDLFEAIDASFITKEYVQKHIDLGYIRPSLMYQIDTRIEDSILLPKKAKALDERFVPPFKSIHSHSSTSWISPTKYMSALARNLYHGSGLFRITRKIQNRLNR